MRRQKSDKGADGQFIIDLPSKTSSVVHVQVSEQHAEAHEALWSFTKDKIQQYFAAGKEECARNTLSHLIAIGRLRRLCCTSDMFPQRWRVCVRAMFEICGVVGSVCCCSLWSLIETINAIIMLIRIILCTI